MASVTVVPIKRSSAKPKKKRTAAPSTITFEQYETLTVIQQIRRAAMPGNRLAGVTGATVGLFPPLCTYWTAHHVVQQHPALWVLVAGGLCYSFPSVLEWMQAATGSFYKAFGYALMLEAALTFVPVPWLSLTALLYLVFINAVKAACGFQVRKG